MYNLDMDDDRDDHTLTNFEKGDRILYEAALMFAGKHAIDLVIEEVATDRSGNVLPTHNALCVNGNRRIDRTDFWDKFEEVKQLTTKQQLQIIKGKNNVR